MTFPDLKAFTDELARHEKDMLDAEITRWKMGVEFASQLVASQTKTIATVAGLRV